MCARASAEGVPAARRVERSQFSFKFRVRRHAIVSQRNDITVLKAERANDASIPAHHPENQSM